MKKTSSILLTLLSGLTFQLTYAEGRPNSVPDSTHRGGHAGGHTFVYRCFHPHQSAAHVTTNGTAPANAPPSSGPCSSSTSPVMRSSHASAGNSKRGSFGHFGSSHATGS